MDIRQIVFLGVLFGAAALASPVAARTSGELVCDVRSYGARANDDRADTTAIQSAINACGGKGGRVIVPHGRWLSGGLELRSDMIFTLAPGAVLAAIPDIALFPERRDPAVATDAGAPGDDAYSGYRAFLYANGAKNLIIEGPGIIDGQGPQFWDENFYTLNIPRPTRPRPQQMMELIDCANVTVRDITLREAPAYSVRFYRCNNVRAENVTIRNDPRSPNTDGIQIRDTSNAIIRGADINTGDDAIVLKSYDRMIENVVVTDSILVSDDSAIKFGTAGHVGVRNSIFSNIVIRDSRYGIALFQMDGGAYLNNRFSNLSIETGGRATNHFAIYADIDKRREASRLGRIEGLVLDDIDIMTGGTILLSGQPDQPIKDLTLSGIRFRTPTNAQDILPTRRKPRGNAFVPPTGKTEDHAGIPASVTIANTQGLRIDGLDVGMADPEKSRHALALVNVNDARVDRLRQANAGATRHAAVFSDRSGDVVIVSPSLPSDAPHILSLRQPSTGRLSVTGIDATALAQPFDAPSGAVVHTDRGALTIPAPRARGQAR
jgi:hypothetical protein